MSLGRAAISPVAIVLAVVGGLLGGLTGTWLPVLVGVVAGWGIGATATLAWRRASEPTAITRRIDPFAVSEPWRRPVQDAIQARNRFAAAIAPARTGPVRERLTEFASRIDHGVEETWRIAREGQSITEARRRIDRRAAAAELDRLRSAGGLVPDTAAGATAAALESQLASADRLDRVVEDTRARLALLNARLDEAVARASELVVVADKGADLVGLGAQIDDVVNDMEALRQALEEVDEIGRPPDLPELPELGSTDPGSSEPGSSEPAPG
jgi:hypothetical protein